MAVENAPPKRRALYGTFPQLGLPSGLLMSQLVFLILNMAMPPEAFLAWGWRIAFLISSALIIVGLVIRLRIEESVEFERVRKAGQVEKLPIVEVLRRSPQQLVVGSLASIAAPAIGYLVSVYLVSYGTSQLGVSTPTMLWILVGISALQIPVMLATGLAADRVGRKPAFLVGAVVAVVWAFPMFMLVDTRSVPLIVLGLAVITVANAVLAGVQPALITEMFPVHLRYSGASISYTVASILGGGLTPPLATALYARFGTSMAVSALIALVSVISLLSILLAGHRVLRPGEHAG
jgi:MFS family permease